MLIAPSEGFQSPPCIKESCGSEGDGEHHTTRYLNVLQALCGTVCPVKPKIDVMETILTDVGCLEPLTPAVVTQSGEVVEATPILQPLEPKHQQHLNHDAHRRWRANTSVEFLNEVNNIDILDTRLNEKQTMFYILDVFLSHPTSRQATPVIKVERSFTEFEELRQGIQSAVSILPPCTCQYCLDFLVYVRFNMAQPRGFVEFTAGTEKRKKILAQFMGDVVAMGRRRVEKVGKRECEAQLTIPVLLDEFLLGKSKTG